MKPKDLPPCPSCGRTNTMTRHCKHGTLCDLITCKSCRSYGKMVHTPHGIEVARWCEPVKV